VPEDPTLELGFVGWGSGWANPMEGEAPEENIEC